VINNNQLAQVLRQIPDRDVPRDIDCWPAVRAAVARRQRSVLLRRGTWQWAAAAAAVLVAAVLVPALRLSLLRPADVSAAEVLDRAATANSTSGSAAPRYHLVGTRTDTAPSGQSSQSQVELWVDAGGRFREETRWQGDTSIVGSDGADGWMYLTFQGRTYATRVLTPGTRKDLVPSVLSDLADLLAALSQRACGPATLSGETTVAGRSAYVIHVAEQAATACDGAAKPTGRPQLSTTLVPVDLTMAIDKQTFVVLRSETTSPKGTQRYEVSRVDYDPQFGASLFAFAPPAGAQVFSDPVALKQALAGPSGPKPAPTKTP
jgi:outer membrane lipoprotein-sorting protein